MAFRLHETYKCLKILYVNVRNMAVKSCKTTAKLLEFAAILKSSGSLNYDVCYWTPPNGSPKNNMPD